MASSTENALGAINKGETLLIIGAVIFLGYVVYNASQDFADWINNLFGLENAPASNSYANAASQTVQHPAGTIGTIISGWWGDITGANAPSSNLPSELSSVGYVKIGASGQHWSCSGPQGASNDVCIPVSVDASGNMTATGTAVSAATAN